MRQKFPEQSQYVVNFAYNYPYYMRFNLREATHLIELRTVPQGHADYRKIVQEMYRLINKKHPVPYVHFISRNLSFLCPNKEAC